MVKFLIQHASVLEEKEEEKEGVNDNDNVTGTAEGNAQFERGIVTQSIMSNIWSMD
jgi:hypothetical protein